MDRREDRGAEKDTGEDQDRRCVRRDDTGEFQRQQAAREYWSDPGPGRNGAVLRTRHRAFHMEKVAYCTEERRRQLGIGPHVRRHVPQISVLRRRNTQQHSVSREPLATHQLEVCRVSNWSIATDSVCAENRPMTEMLRKRTRSQSIGICRDGPTMAASGRSKYTPRCGPLLGEVGHRPRL